MILEVVVSGVLGTILGVIVEHYIHERAVKKRYFMSLYDEIKLNIYVAKKTLDKIDVTRGGSIYRPLYTMAYQKIRSSGYLAILDRHVRERLEQVYDDIYAYNQDKGLKYWHPALLKHIIRELENVQKELQNRFFFLKRI